MPRFTIYLYFLCNSAEDKFVIEIKLREKECLERLPGKINQK